MATNSSRQTPRVGSSVELRRHTLNGSPSALWGAATGCGELPVLPEQPFRLERTQLILLELTGAEPGSVFSVSAPDLVVGRSIDADVTLGDPTVSSEHARIIREPDGAAIDDLHSLNGTVVNRHRVASRVRLHDGDYLRLGGGTVLKYSMVDDLEEHAHRRLFELTLRDPLTRLYNRRYFDARLLSEFAFAQRHQTQLAILLIDVDHFKLFNGSCGHQVGDAVLRVVASSIQALMRPEDVLARYGGDEFVVLARATSARNMQILGERLCRHIAALPLGRATLAQALTVSVGASCMAGRDPSICAEGLLRAADLALFAAKEGGRNRVVLAPKVTAL